MVPPPTTQIPSKLNILSIYRTLARLIRRLPTKQNPGTQLQSLRATFRANASLTDQLEIQHCIKEAGEKIAYLRIITPKRVSSSPSSSGDGVTRLIYTKEGVQEIERDGKGGSLRTADGTVVSNWNGKNLDPCSVSTHKAQLKRAGFLNNLHAKGIF